MLEGAVAVVLPQPPINVTTRNVNAGVFGGQMFPNAVSAATIGMRTTRSGPLWEWAQPNECWNASEGCFDWSLYDDIFESSGEAGACVFLVVGSHTPARLFFQPPASK